jgi:hypothetical protein
MPRRRLDQYPAAVQQQIAAELYGNANHAHNPLPDAKPERHKAAALGATVRGETEGVPRTRVGFTGYRVRPLDPDNFAGSVKDLLDGLRHAGLIHGDEPWRIILETDQVKVSHEADERTVVEIITPD